MNFNKFMSKMTYINLFFAVILIIEGIIKTGNWMADYTYLICGLAQLFATVLIPVRSKKIPKENGLELAEIFVQQNWIIIALGLGGSCSYLAPFVSAENPLFPIIAFIIGLATLITGAIGMVKAKKMTGIDLMV